MTMVLIQNYSLTTVIFFQFNYFYLLKSQKYFKHLIFGKKGQKYIFRAIYSFCCCFFSRDITVPRPKMGEYYFMLVAYKDFHELLVTAIMDTPPDERKAAFTIRRMGEWA